MEFTCPLCKSLFEAERIGFAFVCPHCGECLHCCRCCQHYAPGKANDCEEPQADPVSDKERSNRCEWFRLNTLSPPQSSKLSRNEAEALFEKLFRKS